MKTRLSPHLRIFLLEANNGQINVQSILVLLLKFPFENEINIFGKVPISDNTVEPRLFGLTGTKGKPDNPDIWVIEIKQILK